MTIRLHRGDLPDLTAYKGSVAIDTETLGLKPHRDRLCLVQLSGGDGNADVVQIAPGQKSAPNLGKLLLDPAITKIFHFARFDVTALKQGLGINCRPIYCTKIASRLARTNTDRHGLKDVVASLLGIALDKEQQTSDWGGDSLSEVQLTYAAADVLYLHALKAKLDALLAREGRTALAAATFAYLPTRAEMDLLDWPDLDIFAH